MSQDTPTQSTYIQNDEIDLFELIENIWQQKWLVVITAVIALVLGCAFAFLTTPTYESKAFLLPPTEKDIVELRQPAAGNTSTANTAQAVYEAFLQNIDSNTVKKSFLAQPEVSAFFDGVSPTPQGQWRAFKDALNITLPSKNSPVLSTVGFQLNDPELAAKWTNEYIALAAQQTRAQLATDFQSEIRANLNDLELQINNRRALFKSQLNAEIHKLEEALQVARAIGLTDPLKTDVIIDDSGRTMVDEVRKLYRLGSKALEAEIKAVSARRDNEIFIPGLLQLEQQKSLLESVRIDSQKIQPATIDLEAQAPDAPIKPKKALILALSVVLGGMLGVMIALVRSAIRNRKAKATE
ncbi:LPS O-antigen chain length determinant protein WzzB [Marinobacterium maritimum]|uniref:LPS O-antigen chain length determinant protein WzzB n=1 Tax=Marinobacterium maritimum TaxID=500162 RepID=A0ABP3T903_9GAMM